jgi:hypothetical protein
MVSNHHGDLTGIALVAPYPKAVAAVHFLWMLR